MIPLIDLKKNYLGIKDEVLSQINKIFDDCKFIMGENVEKFEKNFADYIGTKYAVAVNSGTAALQLSLLGLGIKNGDEVITVPNSFFATAEAISNVGATPVFCDVNDNTHNINVNKIEDKITKKTKAILPVHLYGHPSDMDSIKEIAKNHNLLVIEDACQAHGAEYKNKKTGAFGDTGCFSFYPSKNLGAFGEGGIITTDNEELFNKLKLLRAHGENPKGTHNISGYNFRLDEIQGAILNIKLKYLDRYNNSRRKNAVLYKNLLTDVPNIESPYEDPFVKHVYHLFVIKTDFRDELSRFLNNKGIGTGIHYPNLIHLQPAYKELGYKLGDFPVSEKISKQILSLPMFPELTEEQIHIVVDKIKEFRL